MDRSLKIFIICVVLLFISWIAFLVLSTCLGPPLRQYISETWTNFTGKSTSNVGFHHERDQGPSDHHRAYRYHQVIDPLHFESFELAQSSTSRSSDLLLQHESVYS
ncbi:hypothetical protein MJO29_005855 [Puccinia striiformis f. sp. tritici]|uniref:Uncharacterized protein n=2 Tax=Puccinia striiformis TaxID=27350 RepID=A0A0L0V540_9BASI|nr:hypothetical protein Pst134EA_011055 [Puccinia striiformis f. sp. tritici]KAI9631621.1 hypothetical protein KEM48_014574 [Puccinia striiformis f. sp. tritici PST-130]KNE94393.1 hypothetical protein PSTG_12293 [Puccinia striiformis f. sp. tritici PST-78]POV98174.1 hypothetical protein PSTT_14585 [Puccinia striiformis]KAH9455805.1 hypothetical protein Pst134EB_012041 [Puccinia striiformis f. sp. tritici]KAH9467409.1 hypothetical protein Pst134EA_011055 [Puccinia striiformis f. sp. tritici]